MLSVDCWELEAPRDLGINKIVTFIDSWYKTVNYKKLEFTFEAVEMTLMMRKVKARVTCDEMETQKLVIRS